MKARAVQMEAFHINVEGVYCFKGYLAKKVGYIFSKKIANRYEFTAFGEEKSEIIDENPWRYAAKRFDPDLNIIYFGKRDYDPELGRWLTTDPAGFVDSLNLYQYALNNPFCYYDPDGEFVFLACIPFALLFTPAAIQICVDAVAVGIGCWGLYKSTQYAADAVGSPYTLSEGSCYTFVDNAFDNRWDYYTKMDKKKHREKNYPGSPKDLKKKPDWKETTHPGQAKTGSRVFENTKTGEKIRYDKGKPGAPGYFVEKVSLFSLLGSFRLIWQIPPLLY